MLGWLMSYQQLRLLEDVVVPIWLLMFLLDRQYLRLLGRYVC